MQISDLLHAEKSCTPAAVCPVNRNLSKFNWSPLASCSCIFIESWRGRWERKRSTLFGSKQQLPHIAHTPRVPRSKFLAQHRGRSSANLISTAQLLLQPIMLMSKERKFRCSAAGKGQGKGQTRKRWLRPGSRPSYYQRKTAGICSCKRGGYPFCSAFPSFAYRADFLLPVLFLAFGQDDAACLPYNK